MISSSFFNITYISIILFATIFVCVTNTRKHGRGNNIFLLCITILFALLIGFRDVNDIGFGDTPLYARVYTSIGSLDFFSDEPGFNFIMEVSRSLGLSVSMFFTVVAFCYISFQYCGSKKLLKENSAFLYWLIIGAFSFTGYAINGIRNGLACSIVYLVLPYIFSDKKSQWLIVLLLCCIAISIHTSTLLPIACILVARFMIRNFHMCIFIWGVSIILSIVFGSFFMSLFGGMFDNERLDGYLETVSSHGFRWDFLLYSFIPILLAYYYIVYQNFVDRKYIYLINSYILSNAIWILIINASFSNRLAYLPWFLYPVVIAYPLIKCNTKNYITRQNIGILIHTTFTVIMWFVYRYR